MLRINYSIIAKVKQINSKCYTKYLYAYRKNILCEITKLALSKLEMAESLEQLRRIENANKINVEITDIESVSVDTYEDFKKI